MAAGNMIRFTHSFSALNIHITPRNVSACRRISSKNLLEKLGLPEKPKRPISPFLLFRESVRQEYVRKNISIGVLEVSKVAAKQWSQLSESEKTKYAENFSKNYEKYKNELSVYEKSLTSRQREEIKEAERDIKTIKEQKILKSTKEMREKLLNKPKVPPSPYVMFLKDSEIIKSKDFLKKVGEKWRNLPQNEKEKYVNAYNTKRDEFQATLLKWEEKMIKEGNIDVVRLKTLKEKLKIYDK